MSEISPPTVDYVNGLLIDLKNLAGLDIHEQDNLTGAKREALKSEEAKSYLMNITNSKPESLLADKFFRPIVHALGLYYIPEPMAGDGWVDYLIKSTANPPVAIELKALHNSQGRPVNLEYKFHELAEEYAKTKSNQIIRYLRKSDGFDYVLLTNLDDVFYFNREAISDFKPFHREKIDEFVNSLIDNSNIWDVIRRKEDNTPKRELDDLFLSDLEKWATTLASLTWNTRRIEASILLLNKLIFIRTLEDYGLIPFRFLQGEYEDKVLKWHKKGTKLILQKFFYEINDWFYTYYDTELFKQGSDIYELLNKDETNLEKFMKYFEEILGTDQISLNFSKGMISYNFRYIDEDLFGKSYESFLAKDRKDQGIYYTPKNITKYMAKNLVDKLFFKIRDELISSLNSQDYEGSKRLADNLKSITIVDPACGSGPFLVNVFRTIYLEVYKIIDKKTEWAEQGLYQGRLSSPAHIANQQEYVKRIRFELGLHDDRNLLMNIILRHIYGVDLDPRAIDVAKVNIWKEAVKLAPTAFQFEHLDAEETHILPDLETNLITGDSLISPEDAKVVEFIANNHKERIIELMHLRQNYVDHPFEPGILDDFQKLKNKIKGHLEQWFYSNFDESTIPKQTLFYPLEFPHVYFKQNGEPLTESESRFHGVIGNPPWNNIKANAKEFASMNEELFEEKISKYSMNSKEFSNFFAEKLKVLEIDKKWREYSERIQFISNFITGRYKLDYSGDKSLQKAFLERFMELARNNFAILIPSSFHTSEGAKGLRREIFEKWHLNELISFENKRRVWFKDLHSSYKFDLLLISKNDASNLRAKFYVNEWSEVSNTIEYPIELIKKMSPNVLGFIEFQNPTDVDIVSKIRGGHSLLGDINVKISREIDKTSKKYSDILLTGTSNTHPLFEGKMIQQYNVHFSKAAYFVNEPKARPIFLDKEINRITRYLNEIIKYGNPLTKEVKDNLIESAKQKLTNKNWMLPYELERLVLRRVGSSTNERSLITTILPPGTFLDDSLSQINPLNYELEGDNLIQTRLGDYSYYLMALFNSFVLDYYIKLRISENLNFFFLHELPIPSLEADLYQDIVRMSKSLMTNYDDLKRAELECKIAKDVYKIGKSDLEYVLSTFTHGEVNQQLLSKIKEYF